ncbi:hypothetical protein [Streptomyces sp. NPDC057460]
MTERSLPDAGGGTRRHVAAARTDCASMTAGAWMSACSRWSAAGVQAARR